MVMLMVLKVMTTTVIDGADAASLVEGLQAHGHRHAVALADDTDLPAALSAVMQAGDIVVCMGAGSISRIAHSLPTRLGEVAA